METRLNGSESTADALPLGITTTYATIMGLILLAAMLGNLLVLAAVYSTSTLRTTAAILVVNLACVDLLISVAIVPFVAITAVTGDWLLSDQACVATGFVNAFLTAAQIMALFHISVNRFVAVARPHSYETAFFRKATLVMVATGWVHSLIWSSLPFLGWGKLGFVQGTLFCNILWEQDHFSYAITAQTVCYLLPPPIAAVLYCLVYKEVRKLARRHQATGSDSFASRTFHMEPRTLGASREDIPYSERRDRTASSYSLNQGYASKNKRRKAMENRVTKTLLAVALAFVVCWIPRGLANLWALFEGRQAVPRALEYASTTFVFFNSAVNPMLYGALHRDFGKAFRKILCCSKQDALRHTRTDDRSRSVPWPTSPSGTTCCVGNARDGLRGPVMAQCAHQALVLPDGFQQKLCVCTIFQAQACSGA